MMWTGPGFRAGSRDPDDYSATYIVSEVRTWARRSDTFDMMRLRTGNRLSGVLGMLACFWAIVMILASNAAVPWKIVLELVAVGGFVSFLLQFLGTGPRRKRQGST
jgi:Flp pilus assembly protein protease CpaA